MHHSVRMKEVQASEKLKHHVLNKIEKQNQSIAKREIQRAEFSVLRLVFGTDEAFAKYLLNE